MLLFKDVVVREQIIEALKAVIQESIRLLTAVKASAADPMSSSAKQQLGFASR